MTIAVLGTGNMGSGLARRLARRGLAVAIGSRDPARAAALAATLGEAARGGSLAEVARGAEVIVLAVPYAAVAETLAGAGSLAGKVLLDMTNPITPDYKALTIGHTTSAAEEIQRLVPSAAVVKAFNTVFAEVLDAQAPEGPPVQVFTAADDAAAEAKVADLIRAAGFAPVRAGSLANARYLEPLGELNIHLGYMLGHGTLIAPMWTGLRA